MRSNREIILIKFATTLAASFGTIILPFFANGAESSNSHKAGDETTVLISECPISFRWCPPGEFQMGTPKSDKDRFEDEQLHDVVIKRGFWMAETETTQKLWTAVMGNNPSRFQGEYLPVESVSWNDCQVFLEKIQAYAPSGMKFVLPSEAHWEYASRAGALTAYWWGDNPKEGKGKLNGPDLCLKKTYENNPLYADKLAVFPFDDGYEYTAPVGSFEPNPWGLKDMSGNVWEWCDDWYGDYPVSKKAIEDPSGPSSGSHKVIRGGGWYRSPRRSRSGNRDWDSPSIRYDSLGFRIEMTENRK